MMSRSELAFFRHLLRLIILIYTGKEGFETKSIWNVVIRNILSSRAEETLVISVHTSPDIPLIQSNLCVLPADIYIIE